jgi:hypothetical protein
LRAGRHARRSIGTARAPPQPSRCRHPTTCQRARSDDPAGSLIVMRLPSVASRQAPSMKSLRSISVTLSRRHGSSQFASFWRSAASSCRVACGLSAGARPQQRQGGPHGRSEMKYRADRQNAGWRAGRRMLAKRERVLTGQAAKATAGVLRRRDSDPECCDRARWPAQTVRPFSSKGAAVQDRQKLVERLVDHKAETALQASVQQIAT